ncbi:MAG: UDP-N-acetylglucosamine 1-carboxyvinyltransferase [Planctomycetota bacterium]
MSRFVIRGGRPLSGEVRVAGNKNAVLPMLAATLLTEEEVVLENVPMIRDVSSMLEILASLGAEVSRSDSTVTVKAAHLHSSEIPRRLSERVRTSILMVAPLLHRTGRAKLSPPGGDAIGRRRLDAHFYGLERLGAVVKGDELDFTAAKRLSGAHLFFDEASVTATEHILMAAVLAKGETILRNAASEPHVQDLIRLLQSMGARIEGEGTNTLTIEGVDRLSGTRHVVVSDHVEAGSYLALAAATRGAITVTDTVKGHFWMIRRVFERFSLELDLQEDRVVLAGGQQPRIRPDAGGAIPRIDDGPWPQFPSDLMSAMLVLATQSEGTVLFFEKMFESRLYFIDPLVQMGANVIICDPHRVVISGPSRLRGVTVRSPDIRAGMALMIAALCAQDGESIVENAEIVDRGYERIESKLTSLGAEITRWE